MNESIVTEYGYPLYVYKKGDIENRIAELKKLEDFELLYSMKCNPNKQIVELMKMNGVGIDAASANEVMSAVEAGIDKQSIFYSSPGKRRCDIINTIDKCIIVADSLNEIAMINEESSKRNEVTEIGVRINPANAMIEGNAFEVMSGSAGKFGIDYERLDAENIKSYKNIKIIGIHIYFGSQILDVNVLHNDFKIIAETALKLSEKFDIRFIDFGGGYGVKFEDDDIEPDIGHLNALLKGDSSIAKIKQKKVRLITESGRYLVSRAGTYVTRVVDIKQSYDEKYLIVHGGMNGFFRPIFLNQRHEIELLSDSGELEKVNVAGNLCTPIDVFAKGIELPKAKIGDIVLIHNAGAYGFTMSLTAFISHDMPKEILI